MYHVGKLIYHIKAFEYILYTKTYEKYYGKTDFCNRCMYNFVVRIAAFLIFLIIVINMVKVDQLYVL